MDIKGVCWFVMVAKFVLGWAVDGDFFFFYTSLYL